MKKKSYTCPLIFLKEIYGASWHRLTIKEKNREKEKKRNKVATNPLTWLSTRAQNQKNAQFHFGNFPPPKKKNRLHQSEDRKLVIILLSRYTLPKSFQGETFGKIRKQFLYQEKKSKRKKEEKKNKRRKERKRKKERKKIKKERKEIKREKKGKCFFLSKCEEAGT